MKDDCQCGKFPVHLTAERFQTAIEAEEKCVELERRIEQAIELTEKALVGFAGNSAAREVVAILRGDVP